MKPPLIILGAGRSGTNALRDTLCELDVFSTWPCDEINYIWRHGNRDWPTDRLPIEAARPEVKDFIRRAFAKRQKLAGAATVVEKTCANSMRLGYVRAVVPEARFVHIVRDPVDVVSSAMSRWSAPLDLAYTLRKARWVPPTDLTIYASRYLRSRLHRRAESDQRLSTWGPRFEGLDALVSEGAPLHVICAHQWDACVSAIHDDATTLPANTIHQLSYHDLVGDPEPVLADLLGFAGLGQSVDPAALADVSKRLFGGSVGSGYRRLDEQQIVDIQALCGERYERTIASE